MSSLDVFKLIQPDLLSHEELVCILQERGVDPSLLTQSKDSLVSIFKRVALPLPQREFRQNYRGSLLMKNRRKRERMYIEEAQQNDVKNFTIGVAGPKTANESFNQDKACDRLQPPPDMINYERRKIRLNSGSAANSSSTCTDLEKVIIKRRKTSEISSNELMIDDNSEMTKILEDDLKHLTGMIDSSMIDVTSSTRECNGKQIKSSPKRVSLKRSNTVSKTSSEDTLSTPSPSEPERKRKPITWP